MAEKHYDFSGWASRYGVKCSDGVTIQPGAFADMDGQDVTLTWGHDHGSPMSILGFATIEHKDEGPYIWGSFNDTPEGQHAKAAVQHGDVKYLSIYANHLKRRAGKASDIMHGVIREVSLVYGGANPGAYIDNAVIAHADGSYDELDDEAIICLGSEIDEISHADGDEKSKEDEKVAEEQKKESPEKNEKTVKDVFEELTDEQKNVVYYMIGEAVKEAKGETDDDDDDDDDKDEVEHAYREGVRDAMKYNAFESNNAPQQNYICHEDREAVLNLAKDSRVGSLKQAVKMYMDDRKDELMHDDDPETNMAAGGFDTETALYPNYSNNPADAAFTSFTAMLPEFKDLRSGKPPELITLPNEWVTTVINGVNKIPFSRIRTSQIDIRDAEKRAELRARGYQKGHKKKNTGNIKLARRTTDPQTVYVKNELHRDDIVDITEFDYVQYLYRIDEMMLKEELATAILFGDGRDVADEDKIFPEHIRPIWTDDELYTRHIELDMATARQTLQGSNTSGYFGDSYIYAEAMIETLLHAREDHLGTGTPSMFITQTMLNHMLLARDMNGRRIYSNQGELATALNVGKITTAKQFENRIRTDERGQQWKMIALLVNLADYSVGHTRGGEITHFTQFDIDFNKQKSLIETRLSGALTRIQSAMVIEEKYDPENP